MRVVFEGFYDADSGWEFDCPIIVVKPVLYCTYASSSCARNAVEEIAEKIIAGEKLKKDEKCWPYSESFIRRAFRTVKKGKEVPAHRGIIYWKIVLDIKDDGWESCDRDEQPWKLAQQPVPDYIWE